MSVIAKFVYEVEPDRFPEFMSILERAGGAAFESPVMPRSVRLFRSVVPGPETRSVQVFIEYDDMAAWGDRTAWENVNENWRTLFREHEGAPQRLVSVELLSEIALAPLAG